MDRGGCRMNGGGGGGGDLITLEDLESVSEEQLSDSPEEEQEEEEEDEEQQGRLLQYWRDVARGHQVEVPTDMAEPIHQITTNNDGAHTREQVPFTLITRKDKCGEVVFEKRHYEKAHWACITVHEDTYEQSICYGFMKIMRYICQQNSAGSYLGMTIPIVTVVRTDEMHTSLSRAVTVAYYLPSMHQSDRPRPYDPEILIEQWPAAVVYTRAFTGATNELTIIHQINRLAEALDHPAVCVSDSFIVAGYTNPAAAHRQNEIWFLERP
ncbi:heme-binding protein soul3 isoform X2 [Puntigrus tetrazona]|uniref:heme-binding protein soul3 isoform X2 n=1 Tax=Puntigrus tetrazona TaxID=1606681 RepID=UPI001C89263F|nr:heme-binding protein soul3 isoform X2 [Puntigrus tetrazona]